MERKGLETAIEVLAKGADCRAIIAVICAGCDLSSKPGPSRLKNDEDLGFAKLKAIYFRPPDQPEYGEEVDSKLLGWMPLAFDENS